MIGLEGAVAQAVSKSVAITRSGIACVEKALLGIKASNLIYFDPNLPEVRFLFLLETCP